MAKIEMTCDVENLDENLEKARMLVSYLMKADELIKSMNATGAGEVHYEKKEETK